MIPCTISGPNMRDREIFVSSVPRVGESVMIDAGERHVAKVTWDTHHSVPPNMIVPFIELTDEVDQ